MSLTAHRGQPVILNFWAEWCDPCRGEMSVIAHFAASHPDIPVVGIDYQDDPGLAIAFAKSEGANYTLANDSRGTVTESDGAVAIPITVIVDALGRIVSTIYGLVTATDLSGIARRIAGDTNHA